MSFKSIDEILTYAVNKEKEAAEFYEKLSQNETFPPAKKQFAEFAVHERKHQKLFETFKTDHTQVESYELKEIQDLKISDYLVEGDYEPGMSYDRLIRLAMKKEEKALKLFKDLSAQAEDPQLKKVFDVIASEEAEHKNILEKIYDDFLGSQDF